MRTTAAMSPFAIALVAHEGGWDEILLVGGPMVVIAVLLVVAKRRVDAAAERLEQDPAEPPEPGGDLGGDPARPSSHP